ncbi:hypothetical protein [Gimesia aquarii]|uniref:Uncharacterized protein n=1 Tax=Gimesia aquarii TaxID=2527964 RepID=A0A517WZS5_9PLAN|nr:hypothetical protein [Gimesia aquarii]QDU10752.1 hypothetical protein V202x_41640 [Gimesia aquarii]
MPNSNPACNPPSDVTCDPAKLNELVERFPDLCLDASKFEPNDPETTLLGVGGAGTSWQGLSGRYNYGLVCSGEDTWKVGWDEIFPPWSSGSENATGGSFPNLIFPNFSTTGGFC